MEDIVTLIHRAQTGDSEAYGDLVRRFQDMAYGYAYAILKNFELAQDAAQEAFIDAYQGLAGLREPLAFPAWLKRIVHKRCDRITRRKRVATSPLEAVAEAVSPEPGPAEVAERRELAKRVQEAISELPVQQRVVTTLFYINGYSHQEIADFIEAPVTTVKSRLHTSRGRLRERMIDMVEDQLRANALPADFTKETVGQAVARAGEMNKDRQFDEAEQLLRQILTQSPLHPGALKELNRALMHGRVYGKGRWELLLELAEYGRVILKATDDEEVCRQFAMTLLAIPAMAEAVAFLDRWIAKRGPNMERLGMLAWARGCMADYEAAEALWQDVLVLVKSAEPNDLYHVTFVAYTLVDCFAESGELPRAQRVAQQAWERCRDRGPLPPQWIGHLGDSNWMHIFNQAKLDLQEVAQTLLARNPTDAGPEAQAMSLCIRNYVDDSQSVIADWLDWARARIASGESSMIGSFRGAILRGFQARRDGLGWVRLAQATWELLGKDKDVPWAWERFNAGIAIGAEDWAVAEEIVRRDIEENGICPGHYTWAPLLAAARGLPTPPEIMQAIEQQSPEHYTFAQWYVVAREAAAAGDEARAFDALRKALSYWTNSPYGYADQWERDARWGDLRNHPEFKAVFEEKRRRIGPIHGQLHYFPGW